MKLVCATLLLLAAVAGTHAAETYWDDLRVHYSPLGQLGGFSRLPRTSAAALVAGYTSPPEETVTDVEVLCHDQDPTICVLFDGFGSIAGMQISILQSDVASVPYPIDQHPSYIAKTRFGHEVYVTTLFFVTQDVLAAGGRESMETDGTGTGLWLQVGPGRDRLFEVPRLEADMQQTAYTLENCIPSMGVHYYYNISEEMPCENFEPIFALYKNSEMLGFGFQINGKATNIDKNWFESVPAAAIKPTIPNAPECMVDWAREYGIISLHVYFTDKPWDISCSDVPKSV